MPEKWKINCKLERMNSTYVIINTDWDILSWMYKFWPLKVNATGLFAGHEKEVAGLAAVSLITHFFGYPDTALMVTVSYNTE